MHLLDVYFSSAIIDPNTITPIELANKAIAYALLGAFFLAIVFVFYGGFRFIFSGGDEGKVKEATNTIRHALLGLVITILAAVLVSLVARIFGLDVFSELLDFNEIIRNISDIVDRLRGTSGGAGGTIDYNFESGF